MSLKSLINKSVIKADLRRYWWLSALFAGMLFLTTTLPLKTVSYTFDNAGGFAESRFTSGVQISLFAIMIFSVVIPAMLFSYLHHRSAVSAAHCLPISRGELYASHLVSAAVLITAAIAVNTALMLTMINVNKTYILLWAVLSLVYCFVIGAFSAMASMLVGNIAAGVVLPFIGIFLPLFCVYMGMEVCRVYLNGYSYDNDPEVLKWIYISFGDPKMAVYIVFGMVFLVLGYIFYKKRALENHSRVLAFDSLNPIFMQGVAICAGLSGFAYINVILSHLGSHTLWWGVPFGIAGIVIARMLILKTFRPRGIIKPIIIYLVIMCVIYVFADFDLTGFEKRVPEASMVEKADVSASSYGLRRVGYSNAAGDPIYIAKSAIHDPQVYNEEDIEKITAFHKAVSKTESNKPSITNYYIPIEYELSNGRTMKREYYVDPKNEEVYKLFCDVMDIEPVKAEKYPVMADDMEMEYTGATVSTMGTGEKGLTDAQLEQILPALEADVRASKSVDIIDKSVLTTLSLKCIKASESEDGTPVKDKSQWAFDTETYNIYDSYENTIKLLKEWNVYDRIPSVGDIVSIEAYNTLDEAEDVFWTGRRVVTDEAEKEKILNHIISHRSELYDGIPKPDLGHYVLNYKDGDSWVVTTPKMPE